MNLAYPPRLSLAQLPTPLQFMPRASARFGGGKRLWAKRDDLTGSALSGNKLRKLEFVTARARELGCDTLITSGGVQSNHCRATALTAASLGMRCHLLLRGEEPDELDGNLLLDHLAGAELSFYRPAQFSRELSELEKYWVNYYRQQGSQAYVMPIGASDGVGLWGYIRAAQELSEDMSGLDIASAYWVTATGSGGTQAGLTLGASLFDIDARVVGIAVCDDEQYFSDKIAVDIAHWHEVYEAVEELPQIRARTIDRYVAPGYGRASPEVFECIAELASLEGLVLDPTYTGKAFHGMISEIARGGFDDEDDIVFVYTGGIFGLFPQRANFNQEQRAK